MVFVNKSTFFLYVVFKQKKNYKETFFDILGRKECFLDLKSEVLTQSKKIDILQRGLIVHGFCQKIDLFLMYFFLSKKSKKETFFDILDRK